MFPLADWFDLSRPISRADRETVEAQMALYAFKGGDDPDAPEVRRAVADLRLAVSQHNAAYDRRRGARRP